MLRQLELVEKVRSYEPDVDEDKLNRAYVFSMKVHGGQKRASGDPYFSHPIEVAGILTDLALDTDTICTAILHDTIEDTVATEDQIRDMFGENVAQLVDGVTKLSRIEFHSEDTKQAENFRKFLLAMSSDIRVLLVKLADRLHNMRTLHFIKKEEKRHRIALETLEIYAPLAERMGIYQIKNELETLAFHHLHPQAVGSLSKRLQMLRAETGDLIKEFGDAVRTTLADHAIEADVQGREKSLYSIWQKMEEKHIPFEDLSDVVAFRIITGDEGHCYRALGAVHKHWPMVPGRFKDYISTPKRNGYQSLHTTVIGPANRPIELQIRSRSMHEVAEVGVAAHWQYKQGIGGLEGRQYGWVRELLDILENAETPEEFMENTKLAMFSDQVFCFTPKGDLISLPIGSSVIDFAFAVHSDVGEQCVGARINGRVAPLKQELKNGDQVEILTSEGQVPAQGWLSFARTGKARSSIRRFLRLREREDYVHLGKRLLTAAIEAQDVELADEAIDDALPRLKFDSRDDLYAAIGSNKVDEDQVIATIFPSHHAGAGINDTTVLPGLSGDTVDPKVAARAISIDGLADGVAVHFSDCCHPVPGDRVVGIRSFGKGVLIHTIDCEVLASFADTPERWIDVSWRAQGGNDMLFPGRLRLLVNNVRGALATVAQVVANNDADITNFKITDRDQHLFSLVMDISVSDTKQLSSAITALRALKIVSEVERLRG
ncbi:MAG: bifunctional (p)ppGpp synthetase/guanosine-3',5'-bis(diphosphate) 3'-pyrophosphohydrolase [Pseudomonadota bacterium]